MNIGLKLIGSAAMSLLLLGCTDKQVEIPAQSEVFTTLSMSGAWFGTGRADLNYAGNSQYQLTITEDTLVDIDLTTDEDAFLALYNSNSELMYKNNDVDTESTDAQIKETLSAGTYTIVALARWHKTIAEFELSVTLNENHIAGFVLDYASSYTGDLNLEGAILSLEANEDATICLDLNNNFTCDENEYSMFISNGNYSYDQNILLELKDYNLDYVRVLAETSESEEFKYLLVSNDLSDFNVSPMNTLLNAYMLVNPMQSKSQAKSSLLNELNISTNKLNLFDQAEASTSTISDNMKFYAASKIVSAEIKGAYLSAIEIDQKSSQFVLDNETLHLIVAIRIIERLPEIAQAIELKISQTTSVELIDYQSMVSEVTPVFSEVEIINRLNERDLFLEKSIVIDAYGDYPNYYESFFEEINTTADVSINVNANDWGGHHNRLTLNLATGSGAGDLELIDTGMVGGYINSDALLDLSANFEMYRSEMVDYAVSQGQNDLGQQMAIPIDLGPGVAFYRRDYMEDLNFNLTDVMESWDSWLTYGRTLRDEYGVHLVSNAESIARAIIYGTVEPGNGIYIGANDEILVENERFKFAFNMAKTLREEDLDANVGLWNNDWYDGFNNGVFAMEIQGAWLLGHMQGWIAPDTTGLWGASNLPAGIYGSWGGTFAAIPTQSSDKKDAAWGVIEYMISPEAQLAAFESWAMFPANKTTYNDAVFNEDIAFLGGQKARLLFAEVANNMTPISPSKYDNIAETLVVNAALQEVLTGGRSVEDALKYASDQLSERM